MRILVHLVSAFLLTLGLVFILAISDRFEQGLGILMLTVGIFGLREEWKPL